VLRQAREFQRYTTVENKDRKHLPYAMLLNLVPPVAASKLSEDKVITVIVALSGSLVILFLTAMQNISEKG
jgi:hypothetical protein